MKAPAMQSICMISGASFGWIGDNGYITEWEMALDSTLLPDTWYYEVHPTSYSVLGPGANGTHINFVQDGIVNYKYTEKEDEFKKYKLSAVIGDEDADSISADKQKKLTIVQNSILTDLEKAFADKDIKADIDKATGRVSLDSNILFASDSSDLSSDGKDSLDDFLDVYTSVVLNDSNKDLVANIVVEGHTDTNGDHEYNQKLSEKRAETVADYCTEKVPSLKSIIKSKGYSFDDPVYNDDGTINMEASRRVVFKFVLDTK